MKINILLPYKEKFDENKASSVSITVKNNLVHTKFLSVIKVYGQNVKNPLFKDNFEGLNYSILSLKGKNEFISQEMLKKIVKDPDKKQLIEIHNRPYLVGQIAKRTRFPMSIFFHNDPLTMKGSKSVKDRKKILEKCQAIFCVSEFVKAKFLEGLADEFNKVKVLYNGVDRQLKKFPRKKKEVLFVGRLVHEKGAHLYANAINLIASNYPDWSFGLIGSSRLGNDNVDDFAKKVIEKFKESSPRAKFYGFKNQAFVHKKMKTASIIVIPSLWEEPFGLVAAEALSYGICIIASKVGGIPEIIDDNGLLIENINNLKLQNILIEVLNNKKLREDYQKKAWKNFALSSKKSSKKLDAYRKIILEDNF